MSKTIVFKEATSPYAIRSSPSFKLVIPSSFEWLAHFDAEERAMFYQEILRVTAQAVVSGQWDKMAKLIEDWRLTAEERVDVALQARLEAARREFATGGGHGWESVKRELDL